MSQLGPMRLRGRFWPDNANLALRYRSSCAVAHQAPQVENCRHARSWPATTHPFRIGASSDGEAWSALSRNIRTSSAQAANDRDHLRQSPCPFTGCHLWRLQRRARLRRRLRKTLWPGAVEEWALPTWVGSRPKDRTRPSRAGIVVNDPNSMAELFQAWLGIAGQSHGRAGMTTAVILAPP